MKCNKGYKFRIYPNDQQKVLIAKTFGCARLVYNYLLIKIREEIYRVKKQNKQTKKQKINETKTYFLKKINKITKP